MNTEEKMRRMYHRLYGEITGRFSLVYTEREYGEDVEPKLELLKDGNPCDEETRSELLFNYITQDWES